MIIFMIVIQILILLGLILLFIAQHQREKYRRQTYEYMTQRMDSYGKRLDLHGKMLGLEEKGVYYAHPIAQKTLGFLDENPNPFPDREE
jgi:hypothetical protein